MTNDSQSSSQKLHKYRKLGCIWERAYAGSTGVKVNAILLIIGSSSWLLTMTKTSRGGFCSPYLWSWTATNKSGAFLQRNGGSRGTWRLMKDMKEALGLSTLTAYGGKSCDSGPLFLCFCSQVFIPNWTGIVSRVWPHGALVIICWLWQGEYGINNMVG